MLFYNAQLISQLFILLKIVLMAAMLYFFNISTTKIVKFILKKTTSTNQPKWRTDLANIKPVNQWYALAWGACMVLFFNQSLNPLNINKLQARVNQYLATEKLK